MRKERARKMGNSVEKFIKGSLNSQPEERDRAIRERQDCKHRDGKCPMPTGCLYCGMYEPREDDQAEHDSVYGKNANE